MFNFKKISFFTFAILIILVLSLGSFSAPAPTKASTTKVENKYYYYLYSSCYCDLTGSGEKELHFFVSNVGYGTKNDINGDSRRFDNQIKIDYEGWGGVSLASNEYFSDEQRAKDSR